MDDYVNQNNTSAAYSMGGGGAGIAMGLTNMLFNYAMYEKQMQDQQILMRESAGLNYGYNEKAAQNADARTRALYNDLQSPQAIMQQYKQAGLSPSVMAAQMGGAGGMTQGAQGGANVGTPGIPNMNSVDFAQMQLLEAQAENIREDTKTKRGDNERGAAEIENLILASKNKWLENEFKAVQNQLSVITLAYETDTFNIKIDKLKNENENLKQTLRLATIHGDIDEATKQSVIEYINKRVKEQAADIWLKICQAQTEKSRVKLNDTLAKKFYNDIIQRYAEIGLKAGELKLGNDKLEAQVEQWAIENDLAKQANAREWAKTFLDEYHKGMNSAANLIDAIIPF